LLSGSQVEAWNEESLVRQYSISRSLLY